MSERYNLNDSKMTNKHLADSVNDSPIGNIPTGKLILIGVFSYLLCLLANLPAALVWQAVSALVSLPVQLHQVRGTLWSGSAGSVTVQGLAQPLPGLNWSLPASHRLALGQLPLTIQLGGPTNAVEASGSITLSIGAVAIHDAKLTTTTQWLLNVIDAPIPAEVSGQINLQLQRLVATPQGCSAISGRARFNNLQLRSPLGTLAIGDINALLACKNQALLATVKQASADMTSEGTFTLNSQGSYRFQGKTQTDSNTPAAVTQALAMITSENAGSWPLQFQGKLYR